jgi:hypothetical protein
MFGRKRLIMVNFLAKLYFKDEIDLAKYKAFSFDPNAEMTELKSFLYCRLGRGTKPNKTFRDLNPTFYCSQNSA